MIIQNSSSSITPATAMASSTSSSDGEGISVEGYSDQEEVEEIVELEEDEEDEAESQPVKKRRTGDFEEKSAPFVEVTARLRAHCALVNKTDDRVVWQLLKPEDYLVLEANQRVAVLVTSGSSICLDGDLTVASKRGVVSVLGHRIRPEDAPVSLCSQRGTGLLQIELPRGEAAVKSVVKGKDADTTAINKHFGKRAGSIAVVSSCLARSGAGDGDSKENSKAKAKPKQASKPLVLSSGQVIQDPGMASGGLVFPEAWDEALSAVVANPQRAGPRTVLLLGAKNTGKSTACRLLVNQLLAHHPEVAFLDLDLGQAEFTPAGMVSLTLITQPILSPPQRHLLPPRHAYYVGETTAQHDPTRYVQAAKAAHQQYLDTPGLAKIPLVVNTAGWLTGLGAELLLELLPVLNPTTVVRLVRPTESQAAAAEAEDKELASRLEPSKRRQVFTLTSVAKGKMSSGQSAAQRRELQLLNYFDRCLSPRLGPYDVASHGAPVAKGLQGVFPYRISFEQITVAFTPPGVQPALALQALNSTVVGLCVAEDDLPGGETREDGLRVLAEAPCKECLGLGLVRAIDAEAGIIFILTPIPPAVLQRVNLLVKGRMETPTVLLGDDAALVVPYLAADVLSNNKGGGAKHARKNILRRKHGQ